MLNRHPFEPEAWLVLIVEDFLLKGYRVEDIALMVELAMQDQGRSDLTMEVLIPLVTRIKLAMLMTKN